ncbi:MAG: radical SAM protein [Methanomicrobiales archaeon]|nr:radical SAM protein [Methanomicrobiales archaeon]
MPPYPSYRGLEQSGELAERVTTSMQLLTCCEVCPRQCRVDRTVRKIGYCGAGYLPAVSSYSPHFGEEPPLVGLYGSGTIFFAHCNMRCVYCQNFEISQCKAGREVSFDDLARMMLSLQDRGCHNINLVSPSHFLPQILNGIAIAAERGLDIPIVYNSGGYDSVETIRLLDGVVDIYMPDAKYGSNEVARALSDAPDYVDRMQEALREMQRQVGDLVCKGRIAQRGMIIRHLVLPENLAGTDAVMRFIAEEISLDAYVNIMDQYRVTGPVLSNHSDPLFERLRRPITREEYRHAIACARKYGLHRFA